MAAATLPAIYKFWAYAVQGLLYEICFTALWDFSITPDLRLMGESSIWSLFVYGLGGLANEYYVFNRIGKKHVVFRMLVNLFYTYAWEYACGALLRTFGGCPWDYTERRWNLHGLITLEYAPAWLFAGLLNERMCLLLQSICWEKRGHPTKVE